MIELDGHSLTFPLAVRAIFEGEEVAASLSSWSAVDRSREAVLRIVARGRPVYGVNTGFGSFSTEAISAERLADLQRNIVLSHAAGVGDPLPETAVRAVLLFRANSLLAGNSGVRRDVIQTVIDLLNGRIHPRIPSLGSVGSSGDLAPLAHLALVLIGEGEAICEGTWVDGRQALARVGREPLVLEPKEGLALLNGTQFMSGLGFVALFRGKRLWRNALAAAALSLEGARAFSAPLDARLHESRPHRGQVVAAEALRRLLQGSRLLDTASGDVQDAYSLRCTPQVLGPALEALEFLEAKLEIEWNASTDNPLVLATGEALSGGNFHGEILGLALEMATMALAEVGAIAERRIDRLLTLAGRGLPPHLTRDAGASSGLMLAQYTAACLVGESRILCHPAVVDSIPTSAGKEDHNSFGSISARKALAVLDNLDRLIAIEFLCAAQALDFQGVPAASPSSQAIHERVRGIVRFVDRDRPLGPEIDRLGEAVASGELVDGIL